MATLEDLRRIYLLRDMPDAFLGRLLPFSTVRLFNPGTVLYRRGNRAETFHLLLTGKVLLEMPATDRVNVSLGAVKPGYAFGWAALFSDSSHSAHAVCAEPSEVILLPGAVLRDILQKNAEWGHRFMSAVAHVLHMRMERRTGQLLRTLMSHPDLRRVFEGAAGEEDVTGS